MRIKNNLLTSIVFLLLLLPIAFLGCSSGGGDSPSTPPPNQSIKVFPSSFDFGTFTPDNDPVPLEVKIENTGSALLTLTNITLSDTTNFSLDPTKGSNPCSSESPTIDAGDNCTLEIDFIAPDLASAEAGTYTATLTIESDDPVASTIDVGLTGTKDVAITELNVKINQVTPTCPEITAYVSVTDQGGFTVPDLTENNFSVTEDAVDLGHPTGIKFVSDVLAPVPISVSLLMDYSGSITNLQNTVDNMQDSVANFVNSMGTNDEAEIIKFDQGWEVVQQFTSDKSLLTTAIYTPFDMGPGTLLYDTIYKAVDDTVSRPNDRKAIVVITDGVDDDGTGTQISIKDLSEAINHAESNGIPIFTVGLGQLDTTILQQIADGTGGQFFGATTSENLKQIYQQIAKILFTDQYVLTYTSGGGSNLTIDATLVGALPGNDTKGITTPCP